LVCIFPTIINSLQENCQGDHKPKKPQKYKLLARKIENILCQIQQFIQLSKSIFNKKLVSMGQLSSRNTCLGKQYSPLKL